MVSQIKASIRYNNLMKSKSIFLCQQCGYQSPSWMGKCPECGAWNSLVETIEETPVGSGQLAVGRKKQTPPQKLSEVIMHKTDRMPTGFAEFDRVLGGGIVPGSVLLVSGDPGIGKSTLLLQVAGILGGLYISGEESTHQIKLRATRLGITNDSLLLLSETDLDTITTTIVNATHKNKLPLVIVDSIQTIAATRLTGIAGSVGQIREATHELMQVAKQTNTPLFIVGHVTKEGSIAGPKLLEHMVDVVLYVEGDRYYQGRMVRTLKNRFGPTDEVGVFEMKEEGLAEITNPSEMFLQGRVSDVPGSVIAVTMEGTRPLLAEVQSIVVPTTLAMPRRVANGVDYNRLQVILAILQKRLNIPLGASDIYVNVSGGLKLAEPATDLPIALSLISSFRNIALPKILCAFGELGLLGELRSVKAEKRRMDEAKRLGFTTVISPKTSQLLSTIVASVFGKGK